MSRSTRIAAAAIVWLAATAALGQQSSVLPKPTDDATVERPRGPIEFGCESTGAPNGKFDSDQESSSPDSLVVSKIPTVWRGYCYGGCVPAGCCSCKSHGWCGALHECFCRCCCGSFGYAACGGPRMQANCCDGCAPPLFMCNPFARCNTCNN